MQKGEFNRKIKAMRKEGIVEGRALERKELLLSLEEWNNARWEGDLINAHLGAFPSVQNWIIEQRKKKGKV